MKKQLHKINHIVPSIALVIAFVALSFTMWSDRQFRKCDSIYRKHDRLVDQKLRFSEALYELNETHESDVLSIKMKIDDTQSQNDDKNKRELHREYDRKYKAFVRQHKYYFDIFRALNHSHKFIFSDTEYRQIELMAEDIDTLLKIGEPNPHYLRQKLANYLDESNKAYDCELSKIIPLVEQCM